MGTLVVFYHHEDAGEGNEENIEEVNESLILMKGNVGILRNIGKKLWKNSFKWIDVLN